MQTLYIIFAASTLVLLISFILSIANLIYLASISSKIASLEDNVEKASLLFDSLKRESNAKKPEQMPESSDNTLERFGKQQVYEQETASLDQDEDITDSIEIVRNVRGVFQPTETITPPPEESTQESDICENTPEDLHETETFNINEIDNYESGAAQPHDSTKSSSDADIMDVVAEEQVPSAINNDDTIVIPLYSESTKDTDFRSAWQRVTEALEVNKGTNITFDMHNIGFLYGKELQYLEKIHQLIMMQKRTLMLINCDTELVTTLHNSPNLTDLIERSMGTTNDYTRD